MSAPIELPMASARAADAEPAPSDAGRRFRVEGMDCAACARTVEKAVAGLEQVTAAQVSFGTATLVIDGEAGDEEVAAAVARAGYRARPAGRRAAAPQVAWRRDRRVLSTIAAAVLLLVAAATALAGAPRALAEPLFLVSMAVGGWPIARAALVALRARSLDMNVLMALAAVGAVGIGAYAEGAWVLVLFAVGTTLESFALDRSRRSVEALMELAPAQAHLVAGGEERTVAVEDVAVGAEVVVRPGERVPLDGRVARGASSVDESPITGESVPVDKAPGDAVFAGSLNAHGALTVRVERAAAESMLSRVVALVEEAQASRAPSERFVDRFARVYTPLVFAAAVLVATVPLAFGGALDTWLYRALALLIVACPCSLVISVPVAVVSAVGGAARRGVLLKGGQALEDLGRISVVALDKTGTVTRGVPQLTSTVTLDGAAADGALALLALVERRSEHPLARAVVRAATERGLPAPEPDDFLATPGAGVDARVGARALWAGNARLVARRAGAVPPEMAALERRGETAIALGEGDRVLAVFGLADRPRAEAAEAIAALRAGGVQRVVMLTGDSEPVARAVAGATGVDAWQAQLLPDEKLAAVQRLERDAGAVAMVGDGVNDAPALAAARMGVAMGAVGSDVALDSADVALMGDRLDALPEAVRLSRRALAVMRANVVASLLVKGAFVVLAPFGLVTLVMAVAADMGMSLLVTLNALRLLGRREDPRHAHPPETAASCADGCCAGAGTEGRAGAPR